MFRSNNRRRLSSAALLLGIFGTTVVAATHGASQSLVRPPDSTFGKLTFGDLPVSIATTVSNETFVISYVSFKATDFRVGLIQPNNLSEGGTSLSRLMQDAKAVAMMNGGFLDSTSPATPAGFVKVGGETINRPAVDRVMDGFICFAAEARRIVIGTFPDLEEAARSFPDCVQAGPVLALGGKFSSKLEALDEEPSLKKFPSVAATRSFVATTKSGRIAMGVTSPVSLYSLRAALLQEESQGGFGAINAIALTGRITAGLIAPNFIRGHINTLLPNAIVVRN